MNDFFLELVGASDEARRGFENHPNALNAVAHGLPPQRYRHLLLELYHLVANFNPICAAAASRIADDLRQVRYFLYEHMQEEAGHEEWVLRDLQDLGVDALASLAHEPSPYTLAFCGYNYWAADRRHPGSVLGMMYVLEVLASVYGGSLASAVKDALLLEGNTGTSFLSSHATLDIEHMAKLRRLLNSVDDRAAQAAIIESTLTNFKLITRIFSEV